ncbi:MAG TPA: translesion DNA synthesis-associated protein ImuA [Usitatibacter sp.]|nr:translesion DNA synthesis-associated protein ImuA [Usitatibacter sp.]
MNTAKASVAELAKLPGVWRGGELEHVVHATVPTGHAALDRELPGGGWPAGTLAEVLHDGVGLGEVGFLAQAVAKASEGDRLIAWIHPPHVPYAPALAALGVPLERVLVVQPASREDALWAAEQAMRSGACGAVLLWLEGLRSARPRGSARRDDEYASLRRLQMAAESGRCMAVHFRASGTARLSTPAHLRVAIAREGHRLLLRILKRRGPPLANAIALTAGWQPRSVLSAAAFADAAAAPAKAVGPSDGQEQARQSTSATQPARAFSIVR